MDFQLLFASFRAAQIKLPAQKALYQALKAAILAGRLSPGSRLLSSRALAQELGIARNTVVYAYEQLAIEGYILSQRRGSIVNPALHALQKLPPQPVSDLQLARQQHYPLEWPVNSYLSDAFAPGVPALSEFPIPRWRKLMDQCWREAGPEQLAYDQPLGDLQLRESIAEYLRISRGVNCHAGQVVITDGTQSSLAICAQAFAEAGDKVWLENPGYTGAHIAFRAAQLNVIGIQVDQFGIAPEAHDWQADTPKLIYLTPSHQYPTGGVLPFARRAELLQQAQRFGSLIIEDDYDSEFRHDGPALAAMQGMQTDASVIYLGTFSKTMFPALRLAFMVLPESAIKSVTQFLQKTALRGRLVEQVCLANFIQQAYFSSHLRHMRRLYKRRRDVLVAAIAEQMAGLANVHGASAGMHLVLCPAAGSWDDLSLSQAALQQGIVAPALSAHKIAGYKSDWTGLMLGYAQVKEALIPDKVRQLAHLLAH